MNLVSSQPFSLMGGDGWMDGYDRLIFLTTWQSKFTLSTLPVPICCYPGQDHSLWFESYGVFQAITKSKRKCTFQRQNILLIL